MEGSQALTSMDTKSPKVLSTSHGRGHLLFIAPRAKLAVTSSLGKTQDDRTLRSYRPDAGPQRPVNRCSPHVASVQPQSRDLNGQVMTGGNCSKWPDAEPQRPVVSSKHPETIFMTGRPDSPSVQSHGDSSVRCHISRTGRTPLASGH